MSLGEIWAATVGEDYRVGGITTPFIAALIVYIMSFTICYVLYRISSVVLPPVLRVFSDDFFKSVVSITYCFGHGFIRERHGHLGYVITAVALNYFTAGKFVNGEGSVLGNMNHYVKGRMSSSMFTCRCLVHILGAFASFRLGIFIYSLDFYDNISLAQVAEEATLACTTSLQVNVGVGFVVEMVGTALDMWVSAQFISRRAPLDNIIKLINCTVLVCLGLNLTGAYMHPTCAVAHTFGCESEPYYVHILVYWLGPFVGFALADIMVDYIKLPSIDNIIDPFIIKSADIVMVDEKKILLKVDEKENSSNVDEKEKLENVEEKKKIVNSDKKEKLVNGVTSEKIVENISDQNGNETILKRRHLTKE